MRKVLTGLIIVALWPAILAAQGQAENNLTRLGTEITENLQAFYPVMATTKGIHKYDYRFTDYSRKSISTEIAILKKFQSRLAQIKPEQLAVPSQANLKLLKSNVEIPLQNLEKIKWHERSPYVYADDIVSGIYLIMASEYAPLSERAQNVIARMKLVPDVLAQAKANLKKPAPIYVELASGMLDNGIEFYKSLSAEISADEPGLGNEVALAAERAIVAMKDFQQFLTRIPKGDPNGFAIGKEQFDYKLKNEYFLGYDSDSLLKIGEYLFNRTDSMYKSLSAEVETIPLVSDSVFVLDCITKKDVLNYYQWEVDQTKLYLAENNVLTVPEDIGKCKVVETPVFLRNIISGIAYQQAGVYSPDQTGLFYVRPIPDTLDEGQRAARFKFINRRGFKGSVVHEAYPGHHMQFQISARVTDNIRKWQENICYIEGWALYSEEIMYDQGFYGPDKRRFLGVLGGVMFRAARIIVDVKLHTGQMTVDQAVEWMTKALDADSNFIRVEVNRYTMTPTVQMSYLIGKTELMKLRDAVKAKEGTAFSLKSFHDRYLAEGMVPPRLLWELWGLTE